MFHDFARRVPGRSLLQGIWWDFIALFCGTIARIFWRMKVVNAHHIPRRGGVLLVGNHQSYLDPVPHAAIAFDRQTAYIARSDLFNNRLFGALIRSFNAIPLKERSDSAAIKAALKELAAGRCLLIYPEGGRCDDGAIAPFQRGVALLIRRAKVPVVPVGVEGCFDVWPKTRKLPRCFGRLEVEAGEAIDPEELSREPDGGIERLRREVDRLRLNRRESIRRATGGRFPAPGPGDRPVSTMDAHG
ncbi:MAG: 1-acyl-sn-glycerol-3-phosphate acyltransferase [Planctomycetes bacterium]|nr:1-acyl-sn-glycerol-3-phosphate acyltransferase [Planctomycetota bacterium]